MIHEQRRVTGTDHRELEVQERDRDAEATALAEKS